MKFVLIPVGNFMMGSRFSPKEAVHKYGGEEEMYRPEHRRHSVKITKPFYMQSTEVTQGQWESVMGDKPSYFQDCGDNCPVENVKWDKVQEFIRSLNERSEGHDYRLPTEAEWEYANRAGKETEFVFGDEQDKLGEYAWYLENSEEETHQVRKKEPNAWGIYDMHGNVLEWVEDDWHDTRHSGATPSASQDGSVICAITE